MAHAPPRVPSVHGWPPAFPYHGARHPGQSGAPRRPWRSRVASLSCRTRWPDRPHGAAFARPTRHAGPSLLSCLALLSRRSWITLRGQEVTVQHRQVPPSLPHDVSASAPLSGPQHPDRLPTSLPPGQSSGRQFSGFTPCLEVLAVSNCPLKKGLTLGQAFRATHDRVLITPSPASSPCPCISLQTSEVIIL